MLRSRSSGCIEWHWCEESDEYTSCINLEGDQLMNALRFKPKVGRCRLTLSNPRLKRLHLSA
jgi:hypothetical protein